MTTAISYNFCANELLAHLQKAGLAVLSFAAIVILAQWFGGCSEILP